LACGSKSLNESGRNAKAAERLYRERFPNRLHPSSNVILKLINRVRSSRSVVPNRKGVGGIDRTVRTPNTEDEVLETFNEDGTRSIRNVANTMGLTKSTVQRILQKLARKVTGPYSFRFFSVGPRQKLGLPCTRE
jgi:hypothetical protein